MFHIPAHHAATAAQVAINANAKVDCPRCGGYGDHGVDEDGCLYACYCCGMTGKVSLESAFQEFEEGAKERYESELANRAWKAELATRDARRAAERAAYAALPVDWSDDVPF